MDNDIINYYNKGNTLFNTGIKFGCSKTKVKSILVKNNIKIRSRRETFGLTADKLHSIINLYQNKTNISDICNILNISNSSIYRTLKEFSIPLNKNIGEKSRKDFFNEGYFETINSKDKAYFLGLLTADGCIFKNYCIINLIEKDSYILDKFKKYINSTANLTKIPSRKNNHNIQYRLAFRSKKLINDLSKYGVISNKSHKTYFPDIPEEFYSHFIRGVFDGDGSIMIDKNKQKYLNIVGNKSLIEKIQDILVKNCNINKNKISTTKSKNIKILVYGGNINISKIYEYLYKDCEDLFLKRKKEKFLLASPKRTRKCECGQVSRNPCKHCYGYKYRKNKKKINKLQTFL